jgi:hypothetical protein
VRFLFALTAALALLSGCDRADLSAPPPTEADVKAKFFEVILADQALKDRVDITSVRIINEPERVINDYMDGHSGVGFRWCMLLSPKQGIASERLADGLLYLGKQRSSVSATYKSKASELAAKWSNTGAFLVLVTYKLGSNWNKDDPWTFTWNSSENVC